ncbi:ankyrin repeat domain-containing protein [Halomonas llamarensis]|uniref:Ankyrin repeat domain-containing protein n=1 Tax=Halomonas llamarensis TaxID=2945104 RepID=A0ABT0SV97_9GAMM|nr:ankyrin repeat domain-containing protein [Halomonas llamarensis]MCL7931204.1 ankyrin repeat domain-containing protein [Halomonas llamarensis]
MSRSYTASEFFTGPQLEMAKAIERNDMTALRQGAEQGIDLHARGDKQITLMWFALLQENTDAVRTLVELGVHPDEGGHEGSGTPIHFALRSSDTRYLEAMLDGGLSPNVGALNSREPNPFERSSPLLFSAITMGTLNHVKLLVQHGANIHFRKRDGLGSSIFDHSTLGTKPEIAIYLLEQGAEPNPRMENGVTTAWGVHRVLQRLQPSPVRDKFLELRDMMVERGVEFPPPSPIEVREQMRAEGLTPRVPPGHDH